MYQYILSWNNKKKEIGIFMSEIEIFLYLFRKLDILRATFSLEFSHKNNVNIIENSSNDIVFYSIFFLYFFYQIFTGHLFSGFQVLIAQ